MIPTEIIETIHRFDYFVEDCSSLEHISWKLAYIWNINSNMYKPASIVLFSSSNIN